MEGLHTQPDFNQPEQGFNPSNQAVKIVMKVSLSLHLLLLK